MRVLLLAVLAVLASPAAAAAGDGEPVAPFEAEHWTIPETPLDRLVRSSLEERGLAPARPCTPEVWLRRVHLDLAGRLPTIAEIEAFRGGRDPDRRVRLVDDLLAGEAFADLQALKWCDLLRVKAEFPINLWPNAVQAYHRWIRDSVRDGRPYDRFARDLLTSSGSNFRNPPVNFLRAVQDRHPEDLGAAAALTFMGVRVAGWPEQRRADLAVFFSRVAWKRTAEWKEEIVLLDPAPAAPVDAVLPDGTRVRIGPRDDPRTVFADWLVSVRNPWFARAAVNRAWSWLFGRGLVHEPDDFRPDNPAVHPAVLDHLARELVLADWDLRQVQRGILLSRTYAQSPIPRAARPDAEALFACYPVRRLDAEVLVDVLDAIGGTEEQYTSAIPEPFTFVPGEHRTIELADGSITSAFLEMFGRPSRDTGLESERDNAPTPSQRLHLLNSSDVRRRIERGPLLRQVVRASGGDRAEFVRRLWLSLLSREPTAEERRTVAAYFAAPGRRPQEVAVDLAWALVNSKEFLCRH